ARIVLFSSRRRHTSAKRDWSSDVCSSDLLNACEGFAHHYGLLRKQYFACRIVQKIIYNFPQKIVFVLLDPVAQKNLGQMLLTTHLQEQHLFLFFVYLFFVNRLCLLH